MIVSSFIDCTDKNGVQVFVNTQYCKRIEVSPDGSGRMKAIDTDDRRYEVNARTMGEAVHVVTYDDWDDGDTLE